MSPPDLFRLGVEAAARAECPFCRDGYLRFIAPNEQAMHQFTIAANKSQQVALCMAPWRDTLNHDSQP